MLARRHCQYLSNSALSYAVAKVKEIPGKSAIKRIDGKRVVEITSDVDISKNTSSMILSTIIGPEGNPINSLKNILDKEPGVSFALAGEPAEQAEQLQDIFVKFGIAIFTIFVLLAIPLKSYFKPLIILSAIPFGMVGAILGHLMLFQPMSVLSLLGVVALSGDMVMVNKKGEVFRNNKKVNEPYVGSKCDFYPCSEIENIKVPEGYVLVLGDNRGNSQDARSWPGTFLPKEEIIGRAYFRFWPFDRIGFF